MGSLEDKTNSLRKSIQKEVKTNRIPSLVAIILNEDGIQEKFIYGYYNTEYKKVPSLSTSYLLASLSKTITATAVMQLVQEGKINIENDINEYLPYSLRNPRDDKTPITTYMLLTHRAGLAEPKEKEEPEYYTLFFPESSTPELGDWLKNYLYPKKSIFPAPIWITYPGRKVFYSNMSGALLGYLVECVSGQSFSSYCREYIFKPLRMSNTDFSLNFLEIDNVAIPYHIDQSAFRHYRIAGYPATTLRASAEDMAHFLMAYLQNGTFENTSVLNYNTVAEMLKIHSEEQISNLNLQVGLIWWHSPNKWIGHSGRFKGVSTVMDFNKEAKIGVIILCNMTEVTSIYPNGRIYELLHKHAKHYQ